MNPNAQPPAYNPAQPQPYPQQQMANPWAGHPMMAMIGNNQGALWFASVLWFVTWILVIAVLASVVRWLWRKGDEAKKR